MKYIKNNSRYGIAFEITVKGLPRKVEFDRRRVYLDTGNVATTGVTEVDDDVYEALQKNSRFVKCIKNKELELTEASELASTEKKNEALEAENKKLKAQLKKAQAGADTKETEEKLKAQADEISSLKAQLEALTKGSDTTAEAEKEAEGF
jgi:hypothetical protein